MVSLKTPIHSVGGVYKKYARMLEKIGIEKFEDFLYHIPFRYDNYSVISKIIDAQEGEVLTVRGRVIEIKSNYTKKFRTIQKAKIEDQTGQIDAVWFNQPYLAKNIKSNDYISLSGKISRNLNKLTLQSPDFEIINGETIHTGRLVPVYPETRGISSKWLRRQVFKLLNENKSEISDYLPPELLSKNGFDTLFDSLAKIHFPKDPEEAVQAKKRLSYDELFLTQLSANIRRSQWKKQLKGYRFEISKNKEKVEKLIKSLPFELTSAQKKAIDEIFKDLSRSKPMNRLLEGDVGSGKTVVAACAMYLSYLNGFQSVLMAPTEILANQHFKTISSLLEPFGLKIEFRTKNSKNNDVFDVLVGTHAVIHKRMDFKKLGFVAIDEQHRFGVEQRSLIRKKGDSPHVLTMTATPIPRTIALTVYGDLDLSILDEMPKGRREIKTWVVPEEKRNKAYNWIKKNIDKNKSQVFIICPFIEESESMVTVKAATKEFEKLKTQVFKNYKIELLHGKLKNMQKDKILDEFKSRKSNILVATPVVEVGIDIPGADIIIIETAERFGLAQLHQLRGRVGRNDKQAYCLLFTDTNNPYTLKRLKAMEHTNFGAELAELDLKLRGPGRFTEPASRAAIFSKLQVFQT